MATIVAKSSHVTPVMTVQEKGSRNKRKFRADPSPSIGSQTMISTLQPECLTYEFSAEKFECRAHSNMCDMCSFSHDNTDSIKLDLGLSCAVGMVGSVSGPGSGSGSADFVANRDRVELDANDEFHDADWSDLTESQLEELVLVNLDTMFKSAIKKIVSCGYTEEVAVNGILNSGLCCGCLDIVSSIVENTLMFLKNGKGTVDPWKEHQFEDLQQMQKYLLAELVCVVREIIPLFSTGDAMWCLLISDMNVSQACAMDGEEFGTLASDGSSNSSSNSNKPNHSRCVHSFPLETHAMASVPCVHNCMYDPPAKTEVDSKLKSPVLDGFASQKANQNPNPRTITRSFSLSSQNHEEKTTGSRKTNSISKKDYMQRQKSVQLEKTYRTHGLKGASRAGKLGNIGGLILDKKLKSLSESTSINLKNASLKISDINNNNAITPILPVTETELSLSLPVKSNNPPTPDGPTLSFSAMPMPVNMPYDKSFGRWVPQDRKEETIAKLVPRVQDLQNQLHVWTEWANQKVMQAARRLGKDKAELKTLRQEREEVERLKKEKQTLEDNTMKKLSEMENALMKASNQVARADAAVCRLEVENANLRLKMEAASLQAVESAASCEEVSKREKKTLMQLQFWEKQKALFQEELNAERRKLARLKQDLGQAKEQRDHLETKWKQEEKAKQELINEAVKIKIGRQEGEVLAKSREDLTRLKADKTLQKYKEDIEKLEKEISLLRLKSDSSKIAALRLGLDGSYASKLSNISPPETNMHYVPETVTDTVTGGVKRERECVMCLSEEMSVVFLPCAHQVVCTKCNELHEKQGMKDCPSCRGSIQQRISVRYARS